MTTPEKTIKWKLGMKLIHLGGRLVVQAEAKHGTQGGIRDITYIAGHRRK